MSKLNEKLFRNKDFMLLFTGGFVSRIGNAVHLIALTWFVLEVTGSGKATGLIMFLSTLPGVLVGPFAGVIVDRINRKFIIVGMDLIRGLVVIWLSWTVFAGTAGFFHLAIATVLLAITGAFFNPAVTAALPNLVKDKQLQKANSMEHFSNNFTHVIGAGIGGVLIAVAGTAGVFLINGITFLLSAFSEVFIDIPPVKQQEEEGEEKTSFMDDLKFAANYLYQDKTIYWLFMIFIILNFISSGILSVGLPYIFKEILAVNSKLFGIAQALFPAGAFIGAIIMNFLPEIRKIRRNILIMVSVQVVILASIGISLLPGILTTTSVFNIYIFLLVILFITGTTNAFINIPIMVILQRLIPDHLRGRLYGLLASFAQGLIPISMALTGFLLDYIPAYYIIISAAALKLVLVFAIKQMTALKTLDEEKQDQVQRQNIKGNDYQQNNQDGSLEEQGAFE